MAKKYQISFQVTLQRRYNPIFVSFNQLINRLGTIYSKYCQGRWFLVKTFTDEDVNVSEIEDVLNSEDIDS